jgi:hypothetical protein
VKYGVDKGGGSQYSERRCLYTFGDWSFLMKDIRACVQRAYEKLQQLEPKQVLEASSNQSYEAAVKWKQIRSAQTVALGKVMSSRYKG